MPDETAEQAGGDAPELGPLLDQERRRSDELLTKLKYLQADFENYRKRADKEVRDVEEASVRRLVTKLLSALDELELAIRNAEGDSEGDFVEGIKMVYKKLVSALEAEGLSRIDAVGEAFDPRRHEAVEKARGKAEEDLVVEEVRPGFLFRGQVIRPSMVKVELASRGVEEAGEESR